MVICQNIDWFLAVIDDIDIFSIHNFLKKKKCWMLFKLL